MITEKDYKIKIIQPRIDPMHQDVTWYGGRVAEIEYKGYIFVLGAFGDVIATLLDEHFCEEVAYIKDKNNTGAFAEYMGPYIEDDATLHKYIQIGKLVFDNNNWWEVYVIDPEGIRHELYWVLETDDYECAIAETIAGMDEAISAITKK